MKKLNYLLTVTALAGLSMFMSCSEDEDSAVLGSINVTIEGLPASAAASVSVSGPGGFTAEVTETGLLTDLELGVYNFEVSDAEVGDDLYISDEDDLSVNVTGEEEESIVVNYAEFSSVNGIAGTWVSAGDNVAPLLVNLFAVDSIVATFGVNQTYTVLQYTGGNTTPLELSGTYEQELSSVDNIWTIEVNQTSPAALVSEGIFAINVSANPDGMQYEIVQTSPDIGAVPPTPADGFGSTNGGAFGDANIQNYVRRSY